MSIHFETVTRATDLLRAAGMRVFSLPTVRIDRAEYEATISDLSLRQERREGRILIVTGQHADFGRVTLWREDEVFTIQGDDLTFVRRWGAPPSDGGYDSATPALPARSPSLTRFIRRMG